MKRDDIGIDLDDDSATSVVVVFVAICVFAAIGVAVVLTALIGLILGKLN